MPCGGGIAQFVGMIYKVIAKIVALHLMPLIFVSRIKLTHSDAQSYVLFKVVILFDHLAIFTAVGTIEQSMGNSVQHAMRSIANDILWVRVARHDRFRLRSLT